MTRAFRVANTSSRYLQVNARCVSPFESKARALNPKIVNCHGYSFELSADELVDNEESHWVRQAIKKSRAVHFPLGNGWSVRIMQFGG